MAAVLSGSIGSARSAVSRLRLLSPVDLLLLTILLVLQYFLWFGQGAWWTVFQLQGQVAAKSKVVQQLQQRNDKLAAEVLSLQNDSGAIAGLARRNLGLIGKNEIFVWVIPAKRS